MIESDEGFSVEVLGRTGLRYTRGPMTMHVDSEVLVHPSVMVIYPTSIKRWDPPHAAEVIDDATRQSIVENIRRAFRFREIEIDVEGELPPLG